jgi:hypothetical protein
MTFTKVSGTGTTIPAAVQTNATGNWSQTGFAAGTTYKVTPSKAGYSFNPVYLTFSGASTALNFVATVPAGIQRTFMPSGAADINLH